MKILSIALKSVFLSSESFLLPFLHLHQPQTAHISPLVPPFSPSHFLPPQINSESNLVIFSALPHLQPNHIHTCSRHESVHECLCEQQGWCALLAHSPAPSSSREACSSFSNRQLVWTTAAMKMIRPPRTGSICGTSHPTRIFGSGPR